MSSPYVGEIRMFAGNFAPVNWAFCQGQLLPIAENEVLFALIGTTYGGDGEETFAVPDLQSRVPLHQGTASGITYQMGETGGVESVTLTTQQIAVHSHPVPATSTKQTLSPKDAYFATATSSQAGVNAYSPSVPAVALVSTSIQSAGGQQPHDNMQPYLAVNFIISLLGIFPTQN